MKSMDQWDIHEEHVATASKISFFLGETLKGRFVQHAEESMDENLLISTWIIKSGTRFKNQIPQ